MHPCDVVREAHRETQSLEVRKESFRDHRLEIGMRVWDDQFPQPWPRGEAVDDLLTDVHTRPEPLQARASHIEELLKLDPRFTVNIQILQLGERLEDDCDDILSLTVVHGHHLGGEGDCEGTDSSSDVGVINHRPTEGGDTSHGQLDFVVQPASSFMAEEFADKAYLTKSAEGIDQTDNVAVELQRKTSACNDGRRSRSRSGN